MNGDCLLPCSSDIKSDQSFLAELVEDAEIGSILECIVGLSKAMHMKVTAERVETLEQKAILTSHAGVSFVAPRSREMLEFLHGPSAVSIIAA